MDWPNLIELLPKRLLQVVRLAFVALCLFHAPAAAAVVQSAAQAQAAVINQKLTDLVLDPYLERVQATEDEPQPRSARDR